MSKLLNPKSSRWDWSFEHIPSKVLQPSERYTPIVWKKDLDNYHAGWVERAIITTTSPLLWMKLNVVQHSAEKTWFSGTVADLLALGRGPWSATLNPKIDGFWVETANPMIPLYIISFTPQHLSRPYRELALEFENRDVVPVLVVEPSVITRIVLL